MKRSTNAQPKKGGAAKKPKLGSIFDQLEANNAAFLQSSAAQNAAYEMAKVKASIGLIDSMPSSLPATTPPSSKIAAHPLKFSATGTPGSIAKLPMDRHEQARRAERQQRFLAEHSMTPSSKQGATLVEARQALGTAAQGRNMNLEKEYLRLTSHPDLADVRPPAVLAQALTLVQQKWKEGCSYKHACDQLKSIRQDLTVQHVRTALTVAVYECHARIALEMGDYAELRQSLAVLGQLYEELGSKSAHNSDNSSSSIGKPKKKKKKKESSAAGATDENDRDAGLRNRSEFMAYNLMLAAATGRSILAHELKECSSRGFCSADDVFLNYALAACRAASNGDFVGLLRLYVDAPRLSPYLLDLLVEKARPKAYSALLAAYGGPSGIPLKVVASWLGFDAIKEAKKWIKERGGVISMIGYEKCIDVKPSREGLKAYVAATVNVAPESGKS